MLWRPCRDAKTNFAHFICTAPGSDLSTLLWGTFVGSNCSTSTHPLSVPLCVYNISLQHQIESPINLLWMVCFVLTIFSDCLLSSCNLVGPGTYQSPGWKITQKVKVRILAAGILFFSIQKLIFLSRVRTPDLSVTTLDKNATWCQK